MIIDLFYDGRVYYTFDENSEKIIYHAFFRKMPLVIGRRARPIIDLIKRTLSFFWKETERSSFDKKKFILCYSCVNLSCSKRREINFGNYKVEKDVLE